LSCPPSRQVGCLPDPLAQGEDTIMGTQITGGVDTHLDVHVAAALDDRGGLLATESFDTTAAGYQQLAVWLASFGEVVLVGSYKYDDANTEGQDAYALTNVRAGVRKGRVTGEVWIRNAFDQRYVPIAFAYPGVAPSGFVGEMGRPRTFGASVRLQF